jgi:hypothetical protein
VLNHPSSYWDEVFIIFVCVHCIGYEKAWSAGQIVYEKHIEPRLRPNKAADNKAADMQDYFYYYSGSGREKQD